LRLPAKERGRIAHELILSLENEPLENPRDVERAWSAEIGRRIDDFESGKVKGVPATKVFAHARAKLRSRGRH
jgi:putative addiction module component (TIGR02574 family)